MCSICWASVPWPSHLTSTCLLPQKPHPEQAVFSPAMYRTQACSVCMNMAGWLCAQSCFCSISGHVLLTQFRSLGKFQIHADLYFIWSSSLIIFLPYHLQCPIPEIRFLWPSSWAQKCQFLSLSTQTPFQVTFAVTQKRRPWTETIWSAFRMTSVSSWTCSTSKGRTDGNWSSEFCNTLWFMNWVFRTWGLILPMGWMLPVWAAVKGTPLHYWATTKQNKTKKSPTKPEPQGGSVGERMKLKT